MTNNNKFQNQNSRYVKVIKRLIGYLLLALFFGGCAHTISKEVMKEVDRDISFEELLKGPEDYKGKMVLLGGIIVKTENKKEGTLLEIYQTDIDYYGKPVNTDVSQGRFLALYDGFLDSEIYRKGRKVTIAGAVNGGEVIKLDEIDYQYPYLLIKEIHLWKEDRLRKYDPYYGYFISPLWWDPWYRWYEPYWYYYNWYPEREEGEQDNPG